MELSKSKKNNTSKWIQTLNTNPETKENNSQNNTRDSATLIENQEDEELNNNNLPYFGRQRITDVPRINRDRQLSPSNFYYSLPLTNYNNNNLYDQQLMKNRTYIDYLNKCNKMEKEQQENEDDLDQNDL